MRACLLITDKTSSHAASLVPSSISTIAIPVLYKRLREIVVGKDRRHAHVAVDWAVADGGRADNQFDGSRRWSFPYKLAEPSVHC
jgi:hypothetical protein